MQSHITEPPNQLQSHSTSFTAFPGYPESYLIYLHTVDTPATKKNQNYEQQQQARRLSER
jgi:hypothetical protein